MLEVLLWHLHLPVKEGKTKSAQPSLSLSLSLSQHAMVNGQFAVKYTGLLAAPPSAFSICFSKLMRSSSHLCDSRAWSCCTWPDCCTNDKRMFSRTLPKYTLCSWTARLHCSPSRLTVSDSPAIWSRVLAHSSSNCRRRSVGRSDDDDGGSGGGPNADGFSFCRENW